MTVTYCFLFTLKSTSPSFLGGLGDGAPNSEASSEKRVRPVRNTSLKHQFLDYPSGAGATLGSDRSGRQLGEEETSSPSSACRYCYCNKGKSVCPYEQRSLKWPLTLVMPCFWLAECVFARLRLTWKGNLTIVVLTIFSKCLNLKCRLL